MTKELQQELSPHAPVGAGDLRRVWEAYASGCRTTPEVSAITGLTVKQCSAYTKMLEYRGRLRKRGPAPRLEKRSGRSALWYEPVEARE